jgi:hypothetical protein
MKFAAIFALIVGIGMVVQWGMSYLTGKIIELKTEPIRIGFHIAAEMITALCLIISGIGLLMPTRWGKDLFLVSMGMLFYTSVVSPGYFAQKGQWLWLGMFSAIIILGIISIIFVV